MTSPIFQHRHYVWLAKFFDYNQHCGFTVQQIQALGADNPRFDRERFFAAASRAMDVISRRT